jgi:hypothetical protein
MLSVDALNVTILTVVAPKSTTISRAYKEVIYITFEYQLKYFFSFAILSVCHKQVFTPYYNICGLLVTKVGCTLTKAGLGSILFYPSVKQTL